MATEPLQQARTEDLLSRLNEAASRLNYLGVPTDYHVRRDPLDQTVNVEVNHTLLFQVTLMEMVTLYLEQIQDDREVEDGPDGDIGNEPGA